MTDNLSPTWPRTLLRAAAAVSVVVAAAAAVHVASAGASPGWVSGAVIGFAAAAVAAVLVWLSGGTRRRMPNLVRGVAGLQTVVFGSLAVMMTPVWTVTLGAVALLWGAASALTPAR